MNIMALKEYRKLLFVYLACILPLCLNLLAGHFRLAVGADEVSLDQYVSISTSNEKSTLDRTTRILTSTADITITNISASTILLPFHAVISINGTDYENVTMPQALGGYGVQPYGKYYYEWAATGAERLASNFGTDSCPANCSCDFDRDGDVDGSDLAFASRGGMLKPGQSIKFGIKFERTAGINFTYNIQCLGTLSSNKGPVFRSTPLTTAVEGLWYYYRVLADDPGGSKVTLTLEEGPNGLAFHENNLIAWNPASDQVGKHVVRIKASNEAGEFAIQEYELNVVEYNDKPVIITAPNKFGKTGQPYEYEVVAFDQERKPLSFSLSESPSGMTIENVRTNDKGETEALVKWTPSNAGTFLVSLEAADPQGSTAVQEFEICIVDNDFKLDILSPEDSYEVYVGQTLSVPVEANHPQAAFSIYPALPNSFITPETFTFTPTPDQKGSYFIVFTARLGDQIDEKTVLVQVKEENSPPTIVGAGEKSVKEGEILTFTIQASDPDNDVLKYSVVNLNLPNSYFDEFQHRFYFYPTYEQSGDYTVRFSVSDGKETTYANVNIHVTDVPSPIRLFDLALDPPQSPTFLQSQTIAGSVLGEARDLVSQPPSLVVGLSPSNVHQGETAQVNIKGFNTAFKEGVTTADFGEGIIIKELDILSKTEAQAVVEVSKEAEIGLRRVKMSVDGKNVNSVVAFFIEKAVNTISGIVRDKFTGLPVSNAKVTLNGTGISVNTGQDGSFVITDVSEGEHSLLITSNNYQHYVVDVSLGASGSITLSDPVELKPLAYPQDYFGQVPRETTLASILARKITTSGEGMTLEEAKTVIRDTMVVVGGTEAGVLDEAGRQLNPKVDGVGLLSLTPYAVEQHAKRLIQGRSTTLRELVWALNEGFKFVEGPLTMAKVVTGFQKAVDEAWADPSNPESAMAIVLFNHGQALSAHPPKVTPDTVFNHFQTFLFISSFFVYNSEMIDISVTRILEERGIDYQSLLVSSEPYVFRASSFSSLSPNTSFDLAGGNLATPVLATVKEVFQDLFFVRQVYAAPPEGVVVTYSANDPFTRELGKGKTFQKVWKEIAGGAIKEAAVSGIGGFLTTIVSNAVFGATIGAGTGGVQGALTGVLMGASAAMEGFISTLFQKILLAWISAATFQALEPLPPIIEGGSLDEQGNLVITFERSNTELQRFNELMGRSSISLPTRDVMNNPEALDEVHEWGIKPEFFHYAYLLYKFPDNQTLSVGKGGGQYVPAKLTVVPGCKDKPGNLDEKTYSELFPLGDPRCKLQFVVPPSALTPGMNYFRIACIQYVRRSAYTLADLNYDGDGDGKPDLGLVFDHSAIQGGSQGEGYDTWTNALPAFTPVLEDEQVKEVRKEVKQGFLKNEFGMYITNDDPSDIAAYQLLREHNNLDVLQKNLDTYQEEFQRQTDEFFQNNGDRIKANEDVIKLLDLSDDPSDISNPQSELYRQVKEKLGIPESDPLPQSIQSNLVGIADSKKQIKEFKRQTYRSQWAIDEMKRFEEKLESFPEGQENQVTFKVWDDGIEKNYTITFTTHQEAKAKLDELKLAEQVKLENANAKLELRAKNLSQMENNLIHEIVPDLAEYENTRAKYMHKVDMVEKQIDFSLDQKKVLKKELSEIKEEVVEGPEPDARAKKFEADLSMKKVDAAFEVIGGVQMMQEQLLIFLNSVSVLSSEFSHCFMMPYQTRSFEPYAIEPDPNIKLMNGIYSTEKRITQENRHLGYITLQYPSEMGEEAERTTCGFPPEQLAVDSRGRLYTNNYNSNIRFGGRLFRFDPSADMEREYVGNVNYYSLLLQFGRPATPVAMVIGPFYDPGSNSLKTDLFIADIDYSASGGPKKRILRVPIHFLEENPDFDRNHMVGKQFYTSPEFKFSGPTDLEFDQRNRLFISDEESIFVIWSAGDTHKPTMARIIHTPGRRWSGLDFDINGTFYFADYVTGELYALRESEVNGLISGNISITDNESLITTAWLIKKGLKNPYDIELELPLQRTMVVATKEGLDYFRLPVVGRLATVPEEMKVVRFNGQGKVIFLPDTNNQFIAIPTEEDVERRTVKFQIREKDSITLDEYCTQIIANLSNFGVTILEISP